MTYDPRRLTGVNVYREVAHEFSVRDKIQFTAPDKVARRREPRPCSNRFDYDPTVVFPRGSTTAVKSNSTPR